MVELITVGLIGFLVGNLVGYLQRKYKSDKYMYIAGRNDAIVEIKIKAAHIAEKGEGINITAANVLKMIVELDTLEDEH